VSCFQQSLLSLKKESILKIIGYWTRGQTFITTFICPLFWVECSLTIRYSYHETNFFFLRLAWLDRKLWAHVNHISNGRNSISHITTSLFYYLWFYKDKIHFCIAGIDVTFTFPLLRLICHKSEQSSVIQTTQKF